jgi:hypothetical protein
MDRGAIISGAGHLGLILWVILGDWLFAPRDMPPVEIAQVSLMSAAEYDAMVASAPKAEDVAPEPAAEPAPERAPEVPAEDPPAAEPEPEELPETLPVDQAPQPIEAPEPTAPLAEEAQPIPVPNMDQPPAPRPIDRVADVPVDEPSDAPEIAETSTPEVSDTAEPDAPVIETPEPEAAPEEATTQIITEAVETEEDAPQLAPTSSRRPQARPERVAEVEEEEPPAEVADTNDAIAAALAEAVEEPPVEQPTETGGQTEAPEGPPMTAGEIEDMRVAVKACWNLGTLSSDAMRVTVVVALSLSQNGTPDGTSIRMISAEGGDDVAAKQIYDTARRAIIRCGRNGFPLPPEKYDTWKDLELVFDPNGMRLR